MTWEAGDSEDGGGEYLIHMFGRTEVGKPVHVRVRYFPSLFLKLNNPPKHPKELKRERITDHKSVWGYTPDNQTFTKLIFKTLDDRRWAENFYKKMSKTCIFEANIDPLLRFMHRTGIESTGWVEAPIQDKPLQWTQVKPIKDRTDISPIRIMSLDIECYSEDGSFPDPEKESDCVFQIAMSTVVWGTEGSGLDRVLCMSEFGSEKELLEQFARELRRIDPDVITGWNIFGFDLEYLQKRLVMNKCSPQAYHWGREGGQPVSIRVKKLASSALGSNILKMVPMFGRYVFDLFQEVKREQKYERYTLNHVSQVLLGDQKHDMPIKEMFERFRKWKVSGDSEFLRPVAEYCFKDTILPHRIMDRLCTIPNLLEMAKATWVPISWLSERGQQIKVFSQISKKAAELKFLIPTMYKSESDSSDKYQGATVLDAEVGAYYTPVTALDFASLYPSIMMAHNLCYSTIILPGNQAPENVERVGVSWYVQDVPALLPEVLRELKQFRKQAKKDMAKAKGTPMEDVYNAKQLAYKISMNSVYGFTGATNGFLPMVEIASSVTAKGREMIQMTKELVEREFPGSKVRYGDTDSVMVEFDVGGLTGIDAIKKSWELGEIASQKASEILRKPNELELEKVYCPYFLYSKKRYAARKWVIENGELESKTDVKGLQVVRRDTCPFVRRVCKDLLNMILEGGDDPRPIVEYVNTQKNNLLEGRVALEELILTRSLAGEYKSENLAHVKVRDKIKERMPGSEPKSGDRVPYVLLKNSSKKAFEKAEDPDYARENNLELDYQFYFKNHFKKPVSDLLAPIIALEI